MFTPFKIKVTVGCIQIKTDQTFACADLEGVCVCVSELRPWKIQISINIVNLHDKITENTTLDTGPSLEINIDTIKIPSYP